ncbi:NAD(P)H-dependent flavin oxidoreductase [Saccharothrix deserti]|uniref:NAD(P)H-dependent flavin oxidoreductase n=1 Tax=Saccharothrix deserti TaxID=2593674 RepID=UPI00131A6E1F|nr:nitronate monooxygenase [Saccharothrix deserti]
MRFTTPFTRLVGCDVPVQQAPIGFAAAVPDLPAAVAAAGGHGMLAAVAMPASALAGAIDVLNSRTRCYGVNFIQPLADEEVVEIAAAKAPLVEFYFGPADPALVERAKAGGALVSRQVVSANEARAAVDAGCDLVVARGIEAGGRTTGGIGLLPLLDGVLDAVDVPVVAAGGIATHRAVAAALAAGASAVRVGTRFLAAREAATHPVHLAAVLDAGYEDTVLTDAFSTDTFPVAHRVLRSCLRAAEEFTGDHVAEMSVGGVRTAVPRFSPHNPAADATGAVEAMALYAGQGVGSVTRSESAAEIVADLVRGLGVD